MKKTTPEASAAAAALARLSRANPSPAQVAASQSNGRKGGRPREYKIRRSHVRDLGAFGPVPTRTVIPSIDGFPGPSDQVILEAGQYLEIVRTGSADAWSKAVIRH